ncbi:hemerythrin domain-containing protein [Sphaerisporangium rubeum]|uniref:Hemerythrin-like domain-containing protein n=1 Tax=Sphaerisporangium rubeum TaxID=321317 RepID=A0A7X0M8P4_9ACTN|nr:hemerythrin domain-containing protein [Sphaerisporangium rubeum]MBB6475607.1 hemerythrin-like domain-containing protein [Sphaerisporangium rubeum]
MANVFEVLRRDHEEVKDMMNALERGVAPVREGERQSTPGRKHLVEQLITEESKHEAVEEQYFWPVVRELVPNGDELADEAIRQEQKAKFTLEDLITYQPGEIRYEEMLRGFIAEARAHIAFEEERVFPELRLVISPERSNELGARLERAKRMAPTRPHPHTPPDPRLLKATSPLVGAADRLRDLVTGRARH